MSKTNELIDKIVQGLLELKRELNNQPLKATSFEELSDFESLKKALESDRWPEAVNPNLICDPRSETNKIERGRGIIELMIEEDLKNLKFLDFGCGEGHCINAASSNNTTLSIGYDVKSFPSWDKFKEDKTNVIFTTNFDEVENNGPYDIILIFDVLDHVVGEDPANILKKAAKVLSAKGKIYLRTHPFISRHGTHLYHTINKAYIHLVFTPEEINTLFPSREFEEPSAGIIYPIKTYQTMIEKAGLKIINKREITEKVEPFFKIPKIAERIIKNTKADFF